MASKSLRQPTAPAQPPKVKSVRKVSKKAYSKAETSFENSFKKCQTLKNEISKLETIIKDRKVVSTQKDGSILEEPLSPVQIVGYKRRLNEARLDLVLTSKRLKLNGFRYVKVSKVNSLAAKEKVKKFNENLKLARSAKKRIGEIEGAVNSLLDSFNKSDDARILELKTLALTDGRRFNTNLYRLMRRELADGEIIKMLSVSPAIRSKILREVRTSYGWQPKSK